MRTAIAVVVLIVLGVGGVFYYQRYASAEPPPSFRTATVTRGDLLSTIGATGTVQPEDLVDVGAQVVGRIRDLGIDAEVEKRNSGIGPKEETAKDGGTPPGPRSMNPKKTEPSSGVSKEPEDGRPRIDYGSIVHEGTELAYIDDTRYAAQVKQAEASLQRSLADLAQMQAKVEQAAAELQRAERLRKVQGLSDPLNQRPIKAISDSDYDLAVANDKVAKANLEVGKAVVEQGRASLQLAKTDLGYTVIKSPVEGVIIARRVNIGQTVVASLNAPSLFLIAKDLRQMQVWASVNEADIGRIRQGMTVKFTVDAFPGETFEGRVLQTRLNAQMTQNVVTYTVVVETDNRDGKLLPYLTANLQFEVEQHRDVLKVPNAALRWKPRPALMAPDIREKTGAGQAKQGGKDRARGKPADAAKPSGEETKTGEAAAEQVAKDREERGRLWVRDGDFVRPLEVRVGASDGSFTEVMGPDVEEDLEVVMGEEVAVKDVGGETTNPFGPPKFRQGKTKK